MHSLYRAVTRILAMTSAPVNDLVDNFSSTAKDIIDAIAAVMAKAVCGPRKTPRRNATLVKAKERSDSQGKGGKKLNSALIMTSITEPLHL